MYPEKKIILPVTLMGVIVVLCLIPVRKALRFLHGKIDAVYIVREETQRIFNIKIKFALFQNIMHVPFFAALSFFWITFLVKRNVAFSRAAAVTTAIVIGFSVILELFQRFIPGRTASFTDLILNLIGCSIGIISFRIFIWLKNRFR